MASDPSKKCGFRETVSSSSPAAIRSIYNWAGSHPISLVRIQKGTGQILSQQSKLNSTCVELMERLTIKWAMCKPQRVGVSHLSQSVPNSVQSPLKCAFRHAKHSL